MSSARAVVVTGASTGIGRSAVLRLAQAGFVVIAGVRRHEDGEAIVRAAEGTVYPIRLDVTDAEQVAKAAEHVKSMIGECGLAGLVNNAGIATAGPLELLPVEALREQMEVNVTGQVAVTQAFLPALRRGDGRIVNVGSIGGRSVLPFAGAYCASKFALEAVTDALRMELRPWGLEVIIVEPGSIATPIWGKGARAAFDRLEALPAERVAPYRPMLETMRRRLEQTSTEGTPPEVVAEVIHRALTARRPKTRYLVGRIARVRALLQHLPDRWRDSLLLRALTRS